MFAHSLAEESFVTDFAGIGSDLFAGRYRIQRELGRGGTAIVYLAHDARADRLVAVKVLRPEFSLSIGAKRFLHEIRLTNALQHPHVLPVLDSGEHTGQLYFVLPFIEGGTLRGRLRNETQLQIAVVVAIASTLADALDFAHQNGVIHRDVKPENVLLSGDTAYLADFGVARALERASGDTTTSTGVVVGTPAYMSPEQAAGERNLDRRTDVYSLGCVVYEMLAGMPAFIGPTPQSVVAQRITYGPRPMHVYRPGVPAPLEAVIEKALAPAPADRYQTAGDFARALEAAAAEAPTRLDARGWPKSWRVGALVATVLLVAGVAWRVAGHNDPVLDANKIVVFPLVERGEAKSGGSIGDEVTLLIGNALEHTEPLKWIDGWASLDSSQRANPAILTASQARSIARSRGARFYLEGSFLRHRDSATVVTQLVDVAADSVFARASATGRLETESFPLLGLRAVIQLLPRLVEPTRKIDLRLFADRRPAAVASFVQGEREYRRSHFSDALAYYRRAIEADSALVFAALKGAQAANWADRNDEARQLVAAALAREAVLPQKYAHFAHGLEGYLTGKADSAVERFTKALQLDPNWGEAWAALGETYFHLFPSGEAWDSSAEASFVRARQEDRDFAPPMYHLIELALRTGQAARADLLLRDFRQFRPDSNWVTQLQMTVDCVRGGIGQAQWNRLARQYPMEVAKASKTLALVARNYDCAEDGFRAVLTADSVPFTGRWMATFGLQSVLLARGRVSDAKHLLDSVVASGLKQAMAIYIVDAAAGLGMDDRAVEAMKLVGGRYRDMPSYRLWYHTAWETHRKNVDSLAAIELALRTTAAKSGAPEDRFFSNIAAAHLALLRNDTVTALRRLRDLKPEGAPSDIAWGFWESLASERMTLARVLLARGEFDEAIRVAGSFDHPQPVVDLLFLPASLVVRVRAAQGLRNQKLEALYRERLTVLGQTDLLNAALENTVVRGDR